eukprot:5326252-Amphidinium_carterae.1
MCSSKERTAVHCSAPSVVEPNLWNSGGPKIKYYMCRNCETESEQAQENLQCQWYNSKESGKSCFALMLAHALSVMLPLVLFQARRGCTAYSRIQIGAYCVQIRSFVGRVLKSCGFDIGDERDR